MELITPTQLYWITRLDEFRVFLFNATGFGLVIGGLASIVVTVWYYTHKQDSDLVYPSRWVRVPAYALFLAGLIFGLVRPFVPSTRDVAVILIIPAITNNDKVQQFPSKILDLGNEWIDELRPQKEKK